MDYTLECTIPAATLPVTLDQAKTHVRVELTETYEDTYLNELIEDATETVEELANITLLEKTFKLTLPRFPKCSDQAIYLPRPPLVSVDDVSYIDVDGDPQTLLKVEVSSGALSSLHIEIDETWPPVRRRKTAVVVTYKSGHETTATIPKRARRAILLLIGHWFMNREDSTEARLNDIPHGVNCLIDQLRPGDEFTKPIP